MKIGKNGAKIQFSGTKMSSKWLFFDEKTTNLARKHHLLTDNCIYTNENVA